MVHKTLGHIKRYTVFSTYHFTTGKVVGGKLKTTSEADRESLQADWFTSDVSKLPLEIPLRYAEGLTCMYIIISKVTNTG